MSVSSARWLREQTARAFGVEPNEYGLQARLQRSLAENGAPITKPALSRMFKNGLNKTILASPKMLTIWAETLKCSTEDILYHHGIYTTVKNIGDEFTSNPHALEIIQLIEYAIKTEQDEAIESILKIVETLVKRG
ncbi:MAG: hypothetical protein AAFY41_02010 [Bacteroidota bacterium]